MIRHQRGLVAAGHHMTDNSKKRGALRRVPGIGNGREAEQVAVRDGDLEFG
jgi:hypothetical protein